MSKTLAVRISDAQIKRYAGDDSVEWLSDTRHKALFFRYTSTGGSWWLVVYRNGKRLTHRFSFFPEVKTRAVRAHVDYVLAQFLLRGEREVVSGFVDVNALLDWYEPRALSNASLGKKRKASIKSQIKLHLRPLLGELLVDELDHAILDRVFIWPLQEKYKTATVRKCFGVLKTALSHAKKLKLISFNPLVDVMFTDFVVSKIIPKGCALQANAVPQLARQLQKVDELQRVFVLMMLLHGTRIGETRLAKWTHIDFENKTWFIPKENTKTKVDLALPLSDVAVSLLADFSDGIRVGFIFKLSPKVGLSENTANGIIQCVSGRDWCAHDLRKFARTAWANLGVDYLPGEMLLNHALSKMDKTYIHTHANDLMRSALVKYHDWLIKQGLDVVLKKETAGWC